MIMQCVMCFVNNNNRLVRVLPEGSQRNNLLFSLQNHSHSEDGPDGCTDACLGVGIGMCGWELHVSEFYYVCGGEFVK